MVRVTDEERASCIAAHNAQVEKEATEKEDVKKILREQLELLTEKKHECNLDQLIKLSEAIAMIGKILLF